jgi:hypothetical protein
MVESFDVPVALNNILPVVDEISRTEIRMLAAGEVMNPLMEAVPIAPTAFAKIAIDEITVVPSHNFT